MVAGEHAAGRGRLLPVRSAAVPASVRRRAGAGWGPVEPYPLRVLWAGRRDPRSRLNILNCHALGSGRDPMGICLDGVSIRSKTAKPLRLAGTRPVTEPV